MALEKIVSGGQTGALHGRWKSRAESAGESLSFQASLV